jgi:predicted P-loop ATPase
MLNTTPTELRSEEGVEHSDAISIGIPDAPVAAPSLPPPTAIDRSEFPDTPSSAQEGLRCTTDNLAHLLHAYGIRVRFNVMKKRLDIDIPGLEATEQNRDQVVLHYIENLALKHRMSPIRVAGNLLAIGDVTPFDPMADWIASMPWDGVDRLHSLYDTVTPQPDYPVEFRDVVLRKWLLSIVAATFKAHGFRARGALTFQGDQGIGKTSWFKRLISDPKLRDQAVKLGHSWDGGSKDAKLASLRHRIVEWGELEGSFRREIAGLKAFLTEDYDKIRPPYARVEAEYPRQTIFGASVNESDFLLDATGNSRFWTIAVDRLDYQHDIDMQQVFAQLKVDFDNGAEWWLTPDEEKILEGINFKHRFRSVVAEKVQSALDLTRKDQAGLSRDSAIEILHKIGIERPSNPQLKEAHAILRELLGLPKKINGSYRWYVPWAEADHYAGNLTVHRPPVIDDGEY